MNTPELRALVLAFVAHLLRPIDPEAAQQAGADARRLGRDRGGFDAVIFGSPADVLVSAAEAEHKVFGLAEVIEQVSQVVRGLARIVTALHHRDLAYAVDVAKRFAWPQTRLVLLATIYAAADAHGERAIMQEVAGLATFPPS